MEAMIVAHEEETLSTSAKLTAETCAGIVMDTVPPVQRFIRTEMRRQGASGLSIPQFRALGFLAREPGSSLSAVAEHLGVTPSTASMIADRLVQRGLVQRITHPDERRRIQLTATPSGEALLQQARAATREKVAAVLAHLSEEQLRALASGVAILGEAFKKRGSETSG
jgi:DNA-binding MarR family transcriptional regulator